MKEFLTVKVVKVEEMSRLDYVKSRGWELHENEKELANERVYKIFYKDGYVSMCPKEIFLKNAYEVKNNSVTQEIVDSFIKNISITTKRIFGKLSTVMEYELSNGFVGIESTSCVDESNYSEEMGKEILLDKLKDKLWYNLGFTLAMAKKNKKGDTDGDND